MSQKKNIPVQVEDEVKKSDVVLTVEQKRQLSIYNREYCMQRSMNNHLFYCKAKKPFSLHTSNKISDQETVQTPRDHTKRHAINARKKYFTQEQVNAYKRQNKQKKIYAQQFWREYHSLIHEDIQDLKQTNQLLQQQQMSTLNPLEREKIQKKIDKNLQLQQIRTMELADVIVRYRDNEVVNSDNLAESN